MPSQTTVVTSEKPTPSCTFDSTPLLNYQQAVGPVAHIICKTHAGLPCFCTEDPSPLHEVNQHLTTSLNQLRALVHIASRKTNNHITLDTLYIIWHNDITWSLAITTPHAWQLCNWFLLHAACPYKSVCSLFGVQCYCDLQSISCYCSWFFFSLASCPMLLWYLWNPLLHNGKLRFVEPTWLGSDSDFLDGLLRRFRPSELLRFLPRLEEELRRLFLFRSCKKKDPHADSNRIKCDSAHTLFAKASK